jgi:hypothetical protein
MVYFLLMICSAAFGDCAADDLRLASESTNEVEIRSVEREGAYCL